MEAVAFDFFHFHARKFSKTSHGTPFVLDEFPSAQACLVVFHPVRFEREKSRLVEVPPNVPARVAFVIPIVNRPTPRLQLRLQSVYGGTIGTSERLEIQRDRRTTPGTERTRSTEASTHEATFSRTRVSVGVTLQYTHSPSMASGTAIRFPSLSLSLSPKPFSFCADRAAKIGTVYKWHADIHMCARKSPSPVCIENTGATKGCSNGRR